MFVESFTPETIEVFKKAYLENVKHHMEQLNNRWISIEHNKKIPKIITNTYFKQYLKLNEFFNEKSIKFYHAEDLKKRWDFLFHHERVQKFKIDLI